jgi:hypothetical protein
MKIRTLIMTIAALATTLAACNDDESASGIASPLSVEADIAECATTRATATNFESGDAIGVFVDGGSSTGENVKYVTNNGKKFEAADGVEPIYYNDGNEMTLSAYFPYNNSVTAKSRTIEVDATDQSKAKDFDYLFATTKCKIDGIAKMTFSHVMTKITLNFSAGNGFNDLKSSATEYSVSGLIGEGEFNTSTGTAKATGTTTTTYSGELAADLTKKSVTLMVLPQTPTKSIVVTIKYNDMNFTAKLNTPDGGFTSGNNYTYDVAITAAGLNIMNYTLSDWTTETYGDELTASSAIYIRNDVSEVEKYDYALADGTFLRNDAPSEIVSILAAEGDIAGVVYWVKSENSTATFDYDVALKNSQYSNCTHGLIVAVKNVTNYVKWLSSDISVYESFQKVSDIYKEYAPITYTVTDDASGETISSYKYLIGYSNTEILRAYNKTVDDSKKSDLVNTLDDAISSGAFKNINGCTPWYIPSIREVMLMFSENDFNSALGTSFSSADGSMLYDHLNAASNNNMGSYNYLWTSTEIDNSHSIYVWCGSWTSCSSYRTNKSDSDNRLRTVCAF